MKTSKSKIGTVVVILITLILAGVAVFTAIRLYQLRQTSISPVSPSSKPAAADTTTCTLSFSLTVTTGSPTATPTGTPTGTPTATPTGTPTATPTGTPVPECNVGCTSNSQCPSNLMCYIPAGASSGNCRNASCQTDTDCVCATPTPTPTPTRAPSATPTPAPELPQSGTDWPTVMGAWIGIMVILGSVLLAL